MSPIKSYKSILTSLLISSAIILFILISLSHSSSTSTPSSTSLPSSTSSFTSAKNKNSNETSKHDRDKRILNVPKVQVQESSRGEKNKTLRGKEDPLESEESQINCLKLISGQEFSRQEENPGDRQKSRRDKQKSIDKLIVKVLKDYNAMDSELFEQRLQKIAVPRKVGSSGHEKVRKFIENTLHNISSRWTVREDRFWVRSRDNQKPTKGDRIKFRNVVATFEPEVCQADRLINPQIRRIVLACHYDSLSSKLVKGSSPSGWSSPYRSKRKQRFVGAIDAAVPCTILLDLAQILTKRLEKYHFKASTKQPRLTLQLIFFDGEESLKSYSPHLSSSSPEEESVDDSLYGSKHLAKLWDRFNSSSLKMPTRLQKGCGNELTDSVTHYRTMQNYLYRNENIVLFILLDLIGIHGTKFYNTNLATSGPFFQMSAIEKRLLIHLNHTMSRSLPGTSLGAGSTFPRQFQTNPPVLLSLVRDDHRPFLVRGVPTLALIPHPFPSVWHRHSDNIRALDLTAIERFRATLTVFIAKHFSVHNDKSTKKNSDKKCKQFFKENEY